MEPQRGPCQTVRGRSHRAPAVNARPNRRGPREYAPRQKKCAVPAALAELQATRGRVPEVVLRSGCRDSTDQRQFRHPPFRGSSHVRTDQTVITKHCHTVCNKCCRQQHHEAFADLFPTHRLPAEAPWRLAVITVLQFAEALSGERGVHGSQGGEIVANRANSLFFRPRTAERIACPARMRPCQPGSGDRGRAA